MNNIVSIHGPFPDKRSTNLGCSGKYEKPWRITVRHGRTGSLITGLNFRTEQDALAFISEHKPTNK